MSDEALLTGYVDTWWDAVERTVGLLEQLDPEEWRRPTDLPGWRVQDVAAHLAHLESVLAGAPDLPARLEPAPHVRNPIGQYTELGVQARRDRSPAELIAEVRQATATRRAELTATPPTDATAPPDRSFAGVGWNTGTLLSNRVVDVWMHNQDIRRATGRPGDLDCAAARLTFGLFLRAVPVALAKRAGAAPGTTAVLEVDGIATVAYAVDENHRAHQVEAPLGGDPTVRLGMDAETFVRLCGGRGDAAPAARVGGDRDLAGRVLAGLAVTP